MMLNTRSQWLIAKSSLKETSANGAKYKKSTKRKGLNQRGHVEAWGSGPHRTFGKKFNFLEICFDETFPSMKKREKKDNLL